MEKDLFKYLQETEQLDFSYPDSPSDFDEEWWKKDLGYDLPEDYKQVMRNIYCATLSGKENSMDFMCTNDTSNLNTDPFWMVPLRGLFLFGGDNGGNFLAYDPENRLGRGAFAIYYVDHGDLGLGSARYVGKDLWEMAELIRSSDKSWHELPTMEEEGYSIIENGEVPKAIVNSLEELVNALPKSFDDKKSGRKGVFEIKEDKGLISGSYLTEDGMCFCYTFSRSYQGFYDAIAPALKMYGII